MDTGNKKIYFASDFHLGAPNYEESLEREKKIVDWLNQIESDVEELYLLGDIFDFWFEYKHTIPKGSTRFLGKIAEFSDKGIPVHLFAGNHDMWIFGYLQKETGMIYHKKPLSATLKGKRFFLAHGDGLGPGDTSYKILKKIFRNKLAQWLFARIHPNLGITIARKWSHSSRIANGESPKFQGEEKELQVKYVKELAKKENYDYYVFGHRHKPIDMKIDPNIRYINLGDWITNFTYGEFDGNEFSLKNW
jgi:UDP-2,3-diacylglucosamine hydrolase